MVDVVRTVPSTAIERARHHWVTEGWGEPVTKEQERLWCLFFTDMEPDSHDSLFSWDRPRKWVEELIRAPVTPV